MENETISSMDSKYDLGFSFFDSSEEDSINEETENTRVQDEAEVRGKKNKTQTEGQFWQSKYDTLKNEYDKVSKYKKIGEYLESNPELINVLMEKVSKKVEEPEEEELKLPEKPIKPKHFDRLEALEDPDSESGKYLQALEDYREAKINYYEKQEEKIYSKKRKELEEAEQIKNAIAREKQLRADLLSIGLPAEKHDDFIKVMGSPESVTLDNVVAFYNFLTAEDKMKRKTSQGTDDFRKSYNLSNTPLPIGGISGYKENTNISDDDMFSQSLLSSKR